MKKNTITLLPKLLKQTGLLKIKRKNNLKQQFSKVKSEEDLKDPELNKRRNSDISDLPGIELEACPGNLIPSVENKEVDRKQFLEQIHKSLDERKSSELNIFDNEQILKNKPIEITKKTVADYLSIPFKGVKLPENKKTNILDFFIKKQKTENINREEGKYFADEGRHLFKIQSKDNSFANLTETEVLEQLNLGASSHNSSLMSNSIDTRKEFIRLLSKTYIPNSFKNVVIFSILAFFLIISSLFCYGGLSYYFLKNLSNSLYIENAMIGYDLNILKLLGLAQNQVIFNDVNRTEFIDNIVKIIKEDQIIILDSSISIDYSNVDLDIRIDEKFIKKISLVSAIKLYIESANSVYFNFINLR